MWRQSHHKSVWTLGVQDVLTIGKMWTTGKYDASRIVAVAGHVKNPMYAKPIWELLVADLIHGQLENGSFRFISVMLFQETN